MSIHLRNFLPLEKKSPIQREPLLASILNTFELLYNDKDSKWIETWNSHCNHINSNHINFNTKGF